MANNFSKQTLVEFDKLVAGFDDACTISKLVSKDSVSMQNITRSENSTIWRPIPYIANSYDGLDQTANFNDITQLSVPTTVGSVKSVPFKLTSIESNDPRRVADMFAAAKLKLASDINLAVLNAVSLRGTNVVKVTAAASGFSDISKVKAQLDLLGVPMGNRHLVMNPTDYLGAASNLSGLSRSFGNSTSDKALEEGYVGRISGIDTHESEYGYALGAAAGGAITIDTRVAGAQFYTPVAMSAGLLVDNRTDVVTVSSTTGVAAGDCFTIAGVTSVNMVNKSSTGQLKTFRVISVDSGTTMTISPPIISAQGGTAAELQYKNVAISGAGSATAAITWLNTAAAPTNVFFAKDAVSLIPGSLHIPAQAGAGAVISGTSKNGIPVQLSAFFDINTSSIKYRLDVLWGVSVLAPEMAGVLICNQV
jgi:hypothetical protein